MGETPEMLSDGMEVVLDPLEIRGRPGVVAPTCWRSARRQKGNADQVLAHAVVDRVDRGAGARPHGP